MLQSVYLVISSQAREALQNTGSDLRHTVEHVLHARMVLLSDPSDQRLPMLEIARQAGMSRSMV